MRLYEVMNTGAEDDERDLSYYVTAKEGQSAARARAALGQAATLSSVVLPKLVKLKVAGLLNGIDQLMLRTTLAEYSPHGQQNTDGKYEKVRVQRIEIEG